MKDIFQRTPYVIAFKSTALLSFILGAGLLSITLWVVMSLSEHDFGLSETNDPTSSKFRIVIDVWTIEDTKISNKPSLSTNQKITTNASSNSSSSSPNESLEKFKTTWKSVSPYFQGSCGVALMLGLLQLISCISVLTSSSKGASKPLRLKLWKAVHLLISLLLICCFLIPITVDQNQKDGGIREHLSKVMMVYDVRNKKPNSIISKNSSLISSHSSNDTEPTLLDTESVDNMGLLYIALLVDSIGILILVVFLHIALKHLDYDSSGKITSTAVANVNE